MLEIPMINSFVDLIQSVAILFLALCLNRCVVVKKED